MFAPSKLALLAITGLGLISGGAAAPVEVEVPPADAAAAHQGWVTHYSPAVGTGACGWNNADSAHVAAIGTALFQSMMVDGNPNHSKACGKMAHITWQGKSTKVKVVDRCTACSNDDIDLSPAAFKDLAPLAQGKLTGATWMFV